MKKFKIALDESYIVKNITGNSSFIFDEHVSIAVRNGESSVEQNLRILNPKIEKYNEAMRNLPKKTLPWMLKILKGDKDHLSVSEDQRFMWTVEKLTGKNMSFPSSVEVFRDSEHLGSYIMLRIENAAFLTKVNSNEIHYVYLPRDNERYFFKELSIHNYD